MNGRELCDILMDQFDGFRLNGPRGVVTYIDRAQKMLKQVESEKNIVYNNNGRLPVLNTSSNVYNYNLPSTIWRIGGVYVESEDFRYNYGNLTDLSIFGDYGRRSRTGAVRSIEIAGITHYLVPYIRSWDWSSEQPAHVTFTENPGDSTRYRYLGYERCPDFSSPNSALAISPPYDDEYLYPAAARLMEGIIKGDYIQARRDVQALRNEFWSVAENAGYQGDDYEIPSRPYG